MVRTTLGEVVDITMGRQRSPQHAVGEHVVPYLRAANVKDGRLDLSDVLEMNFSPAEQQTFALRTGDVLVTEGCGSLREIGAAARWNGELDSVVCFQNTLLRLRAIDGVTDPSFIEVWARHAHATGIFARVASGTNIFHIGSTRARDIPIVLPSLTQQRRIADLSSHFERAAAAARTEASCAFRALDAAREHLIGSGSHPRRRLGDVLLRISGGHSPVTSGRPANDGERGVLKLSAVQPGRFIPSETKALDPTTAMPEAALVRPADVLITRSNTLSRVGAACYVDKVGSQTYLSDLTLRLTPIENLIDSQYMCEALLTRNARRQIEGSARGTSASMRKISRQLLVDYSIEVPKDLADQRRIAKALLALRRIAEQATELATRLEVVRGALVGRLIGGAIEVPDSYDKVLEHVS